MLFRAPIPLYRARLGVVFGKRFLMLEHTGRKSGERRRTILEVVLDTDEATYVAAAWGSKAHWLRNIEADPHVVFHIGSRRFATTAVVVDREEAAEVMAAYASAHPRALDRLASFMLDDPGDTLEAKARNVADTIPMVRLPKTAR